MKRFAHVARTLTCVIGVALWSASASAQTSPPRAMERGAAQSEQPAAKASETTQDYVEKSAIGDIFEIQSSELALKQARSPEVKAFAQRMVNDHANSTHALKAGIQSANIQVKIPEALDKAHKAKLGNLQKAKGKDFDQAYMREQIAAHKSALELHQTYAEKGDSAPLKNFAANTATIVEEHLREAQEIVQGAPPQSSSTR